MAEITLKDGSKIRTFPRAPTGFDPLSAAPAELERYGFPSRRGDRVLWNGTGMYGAG